MKLFSTILALMTIAAGNAIVMSWLVGDMLGVPAVVYAVAGYTVVGLLLVTIVALHVPWVDVRADLWLWQLRTKRRERRRLT
jgi:hypothetical protein